MRFAKLKLVDDWKQGWKWVSTQSMGAAIAFLTTWALMPEDLKAHVPPDIAAIIAVILLVLGFIGRFLKQGAPENVAVTSEKLEASAVCTKRKRKPSGGKSLAGKGKPARGGKKRPY